jgi:RNA polymerase sigma-70 factor, ECF subfamily
VPAPSAPDPVEGDLVQRFLAALDGEARRRFEGALDAAGPDAAGPDVARPPGLLEALQEALAQGRTAWPDLELSADAFLPYLAARLPDDVDPARPLEGLRVTDLYLACACAQGLVGAVERFEAAFGLEIKQALTRFKITDETIDEVRQAVRHLLFVARPDGRPPLITKYSGCGRLRNWACVTASREAIALFRRSQVELPTDGNLLTALADAEVEADPELRHMKAHYRAEFKLAFAQAMTALSARDRTLLRYQYLDGLNIDAIGSIYRVHRATAARWLARARKQILAQTRQALMRNIQVDRSEFDSIMRLIQSRLDVTLRRFLTSSGGGGGGGG